jgi:two-component system, cell cycle sensor histidine kinase and response regulator CckA
MAEFWESYGIFSVLCGGAVVLFAALAARLSYGHRPARMARASWMALVAVLFAGFLLVDRAHNAEERAFAVAGIALAVTVLAASAVLSAVYRAEIEARVEAEQRLRASLDEVRRENAERIAAEAARRESENRLALHFELTPLAYIEWNLNMEVLRWNPAAERIFGYSAREAMGRRLEELIVPEKAQAEVRALCARLAIGSAPLRNVNENRTRDGRTLVCEWHNTPLVDAQGRHIAIASHAQDITERVRLEQHVRQTQKMESMGQLAGGVAHEFNNLLTPMLMQMGQLQAAYAHDTRLVELLRPVEDAIMQAAQLNQRILAVGRRQPEAQVLGDLNQMIEVSVDLLRHTLDRRIELKLELRPRLPHARLSKGAIMQVLMNLVLNARDSLLSRLAVGVNEGWTPCITVGTSLRVAVAQGTRREEEWLVLEVADNGEGIPVELQRRIFEPFFTTKSAGQGTGLGLAVVWSVVESLGGNVELRSHPGMGASFIVSLPVARLDDPAPVPPPRRVSGIPRMEGLRVLLVEDNDLVRETFRAALREAGHDVVCAYDGQAGLEALMQASDRPYDVLIADLNMPRLSGRELLGRSQGRGWARAVLVVSGVIDPLLGEELCLLGADRVLAKPLGMAELINAVSEVARETAGRR